MQFPFYSVALQAGVARRLPYAGVFFGLHSAGAARSVDITFEKSGQTFKKIPGMSAGFSGGFVFDAVILESSVNTTVDFFASSFPIQMGNKDGINVSIPGGVSINNTAAERVPVDVGGATVQVTLGGLTDLSHAAPVSVGVAATLLCAADASMKKRIFRNDHATAKIALGGAGVTLANGAIVLLPGDIWKEEDAAGAAWYAVSDTAATDVQVMGIK